MVECGSAGVWDRGIIGMCNAFMGSGVYCLFTVMSTMVKFYVVDCATPLHSDVLRPPTPNLKINYICRT
jgi:hypothetical protein